MEHPNPTYIILNVNALDIKILQIAATFIQGHEEGEKSFQVTIFYTDQSIKK